MTEEMDKEMDKEIDAIVNKAIKNLEVETIAGFSYNLGTIMGYLSTPYIKSFLKSKGMMTEEIDHVREKLRNMAECFYKE